MLTDMKRGNRAGRHARPGRGGGECQGPRDIRPHTPLPMIQAAGETKRSREESSVSPKPSLQTPQPCRETGALPSSEEGSWDASLRCRPCVSRVSLLKMGSQVLPGRVKLTAWDPLPLGDLTLSLKQPHPSLGATPGRQTGPLRLPGFGWWCSPCPSLLCFSLHPCLASPGSPLLISSLMPGYIPDLLSGQLTGVFSV